MIAVTGCSRAYGQLKILEPVLGCSDHVGMLYLEWRLAYGLRTSMREKGKMLERDEMNVAIGGYG